VCRHTPKRAGHPAGSIDEGASAQAPPIVLASLSPRRRQLLRENGYVFDAIDPGVDDAELDPDDADPSAWAMALAHLKARSGANRLFTLERDDTGASQPIVLGADTIVVHGSSVIGQPVDADDARRIIRRLCASEHNVVTGVALVTLDESGSLGERSMHVDAATVRVGSISDDAVDAYIRSGDWRGKAGAYNYAERHAAGWPLACVGDVATVMGLPMKLFGDWLALFTNGASAGRRPTEATPT